MGLMPLCVPGDSDLLPTAPRGSSRGSARPGGQRTWRPADLAGRDVSGQHPDRGGPEVREGLAALAAKEEHR